MGKDTFILAEAFVEWYRDRSYGMAASLAFFAFLAFAPLLAFVLVLSSMFLGEKEATSFLELISTFVHPEFFKVLKMLLVEDYNLNEDALLSLSIIGGAALIIGAAEYFEQLKSTIENVWNLRREKFTFKAYLELKFKTFIITLTTILIVATGLLLTNFILGLINNLAGQHSSNAIQWIVGHLMALISFTGLALFYFSFIPPVHFSWKLAFPGALMAGTIQVLGRIILRGYLNLTVTAETANIETILLFLFWLFYSSQVLIFAAEFSKLYICRKLNIDPQKMTFE